MFGGTPSNLGLVVSRSRPRRSGHRREPADADQARQDAGRRRTCWRWRATSCEDGRAAIRVASDLLRADRDPSASESVSDVTTRDGDGRQRAGPARARRGAVRQAGRSVPQPDPVTRGTRTMDGKSILGLLLLAAARGTEHRRSRPTAPDEAAGLDALVRAGRARIRGRMTQPDRPRRRAGRRGRPGASWPCARRARSATGWRRAASTASASGCAPRASGRARELEEISSRVSRTVGPAQAAIFAAQLLMLDDPLLVRRADELIRTERINADWALERAIAELHERLRARRRRLAARARRRSRRRRRPAAAQPAAGPRSARRSRPGARAAADPRRRRAAAVGRPRSSTGRAFAAWCATSAARRITPSSSCDRSACRRSSAWAARPQLILRRARCSRSTARTGEVVVEPSTTRCSSAGGSAAQIAAAGVRALDDAARRGRPPRPTACASASKRTSRSPTKSARVRDAGAEGIGLYRSEFLLDAVHPDAATEDAQVETYRALLDGDAAAAGHDPHVRRRRRAVGDDAARRRAPRSLRPARHPRGAAARRAVPRRRFARCCARPTPGTLRILLPFVTSADEMRQARVLIDEIAREAGRGRDACRSAR